MKTLLILSMTALFVACKSKQDSMNSENDMQKDHVHIVAEIGSTDEASSDLTINSVSVNGNEMMINLSYSGGCNEHEFKMYGNVNISKSLPPIRSIQLYHNNNGDSCKALITKDIHVDIKSLAYKQEKGSTIYLKLEGWKDRITYTFE